jgi:uncharacterized phage protein gp47/JayE
VSTLIPSAKAGAVPLPEGVEACGCCEGIETATPQAGFNRAALSAVAYRIGDHAQFRASLIAGLSSSGFAPLTRLLTRESDDATIALCDAFACAADVLTFYQERIANESWLRTATERVSLQELGKLIAYRLRPGVAAETWLAFAMETPPAPPPTLAPEPGAFVAAVPERVSLEAGVEVTSVPGPGETPQTFETGEAIEARWQWNAMRAIQDERRLPGSGAVETWLEGTNTQLKPGDVVVFTGPQFAADARSDQWDRRVVLAVEPDDGNRRTRIAWQAPLENVPASPASASAPTIHAMRTRAAIFGHNAPDWHAMSDEFKATYLGLSSPADLTSEHRREWPSFDIYAPSTVDVSITDLASVLEVPAVLADLTSLLVSRAGPDAPGGVSRAVAPGTTDSLRATEVGRVFTGRIRTRVSLDRDYPAIVAGGLCLLEKSDRVELYKLTGVMQGSRAEFAISGKSTYMQLSGENLSSFANAVRETAVYAQSETLSVARAPLSTPVAGDTIQVAADVAGMAAGRRVLVKGLRASNGAPMVHAAKVQSATPAALAGDGGTLAIDPPLPAALRRSSVVVYGNVALASHGKTVTQVLGAGDAARPFQRFDLKQAPLTYRAAPTETGAASALTVRVSDVQWSECATLYGASPAERAYTVQVDEQGKRWVQFGDGVRGARLPSGINNVQATYRKGIGAEGNVRAETLTQLASRPLGLKSVSNPTAAQGGTDPEPPGAARRTMPLMTRTLGRAVSLLDYEDFARAFSGVAKAQAAVLQLATGPVIAITIAGAGNAQLTDSHPVWSNLLAALVASGDPHVRVRLLTHQASTFRVGLKIKCDPARDPKRVLADVEAALRAQYAFDARELGQPVQQSEVVAVAHRVPGVIALDLDLLYGGSLPLVQTIPSRRDRLLASRMRVAAGVPLAAEILTLHPGPLARLEVMP